MIIHTLIPFFPVPPLASFFLVLVSLPDLPLLFILRTACPSFFL